MNSDVAGGIVLFAVLLLGLSFGWGWGAGQLEASTQNKYIHWVEDCWPNKPSWSDPKGTCWVDGQRVIVNSERRE
jgi:hypothetical protein